ncbi:MAG TPA: hypothetical protein VKG44_02855 [Candidatus Baltobacteraceae bacterium]|nr:hypothetical protein [Candidatus Baltobacteraceae bacterium]
MKRIAPALLGVLLLSLLNAGPSTAITYTWKAANPSALVAYQVGGGVITLAGAAVNACQMIALSAESKPFVYAFKTAWPSGVLCTAKTVAKIAAYYQSGTPATVKVHTKGGTTTVTVQPPPPTQPSIGHLPFH